MKSIKFLSGAKIIKGIMDWLQTSKEQSISDRSLDNALPGILRGEPVNVNPNEFHLTPTISGTFYYVNVGPGTAYDSNNNRVIIDLTGAAINYSLSNVTTTTNTGDANPANWQLTPSSTGSYLVPITPGITNYIWVRYLQTIDINYFTLHKITNYKQFYKQLDGFKILISTTNTPLLPPASEDGNNYIYLGNIINTTVDQTQRTYYGFKPRRSQVSMPLNDLSDATQTYTLSSTTTINNIFIDDHTRAIGNSALVSNRNPHGTSIYDAGFTDDYRVSLHNSIQHTSGFVSDPNITPTLACLTPSKLVGTGGFSDLLGLKKLAWNGGSLSSIYNEFVVLEGNSGDPLTSKILDKSVQLGTTNADTSLWQVAFDGNPSGTYYVFVDKLTSSITFANSTASYPNGLPYPLGNNLEQLMICSVSTTNHSPTISINNIIDMRVFGTIGRKDLQSNIMMSKGTDGNYYAVYAP